MIEKVREVLKYANRHVEVFDDDVRFSDGSAGTHVRVVAPQENGQAVVVLPVGDEGIGLVRTYRYPVGEWQWALPRGFGHGGDRLGAARAELREEMGVEATNWDFLGELTPDSGLLAGKVAVMLARVGRADVQPEDTREVDDARWFSVEDVLAMARTGEIQDGFTLSSLLLALLKGLIVT